jgi:peptide methionine sulfoxide reductase msrA/msrB
MTLRIGLQYFGVSCLSLGLAMCGRRPPTDSAPGAPAASLATALEGTAAPDPEQSAPSSKSVAILAGGCFWGMQEILRGVPGVLETEVGYTGGTTRTPRYDVVSSGASGHAEAVRVVFDPARISYEDLLEKWFFRMHDPTTPNRQGNDRGTQYRSAIFVSSPDQRLTAEAVKRRVDASGKWDAPIVTEIVQAGEFTPAEGYHQDYLQKHPGGYTCHYLRD